MVHASSRCAASWRNPGDDRPASVALLSEDWSAFTLTLILGTGPGRLVGHNDTREQDGWLKSLFGRLAE